MNHQHFTLILPRNVRVKRETPIPRKRSQSLSREEGELGGLDSSLSRYCPNSAGPRMSYDALPALSLPGDYPSNNQDLAPLDGSWHDSWHGQGRRLDRRREGEPSAGAPLPPGQGGLGTEVSGSPAGFWPYPDASDLAQDEQGWGEAGAQGCSARWGERRFRSERTVAAQGGVPTLWATVTVLGLRVVGSLVPLRGHVKAWLLMGLKYADELPRCPGGCDCLEHHEPRTLVAFRLMNKDPSEDDFEPGPKLKGAAPSFGVPRCGNLALSFYCTVKKAQRRVAQMIDKGVDVAAKCGDRIGEIALVPSDGHLSERPSSTGHLNLFQDEHARFAPRVAQYYPWSDSVGAERDAS